MPSAVAALPQAMSLLKHNPSTNFGKPLGPAVGRRPQSRCRAGDSVDSRPPVPHQIQCQCPAGHELPGCRYVVGMANEEMQDMLCSACGEGGAADTAIEFGQPIARLQHAMHTRAPGPATSISAAYLWPPALLLRGPCTMQHKFEPPARSVCLSS
jgi:hypothetical protein